MKFHIPTRDIRPRWRDLPRLAADGLRDLLFPPRCAGCDELLPAFSPPSTVYCPLCRTAWEAARAHKRETDGRIDPATLRHHYLVPYRSGHTTGAPERLIYQIKHRGDPRHFTFVADLLRADLHIAIEAVRAELASAGYSAEVVAKPPLVTYPPRRRVAVNADGFDQAERLSRAVAKQIGGEQVRALRRARRPTVEQKTLDADERLQNAGAAYVLEPKTARRVSGRIVVLCDDLCTTGATLGACESLLSQAGAAAVLWVTVAKTDNGMP